MLPKEIVDRLFNEGDVIGLKMKMSNDEKVFYFLVNAVESPSDLEDFSLGAAAAQNTTGTDWDEIVDANGRYILEPEFENIAYQIFYGVHPSYIWTYRRYPANVDRGSLRGTRSIGDRTYRVGKIDGMTSPYRSPSSRSEFFTLKGLHPAFLGYNPYTEPASVTVRMNFYVVSYGVEQLSYPTAEQIAKARVRTMGGRTLMEAPTWVR